VPPFVIAFARNYSPAMNFIGCEVSLRATFKRRAARVNSVFLQSLASDEEPKNYTRLSERLDEIVARPMSASGKPLDSFCHLSR
jgi:hypothetical protein